MAACRWIAVVLAVCQASWGAMAQGGLDGTYRGTQSTLVSNNSQFCDNKAGRTVTVVVRDGRFEHRWSDQFLLQVAVPPSGQFRQSMIRSASLSAVPLDIEGSIAGAVLEAEIGTTVCRMRWKLVRQDGPAAR